MAAQLVHVGCALVVDVDEPDDGARALGDELPRHDVGVVLEHVSTISSPGFRLAPPHEWATRLMASVAPRTHTTSSATAH
jgi:hypothetical protein